MTKNCALGFSAGFGLGIGLAFLLAPQAGEEAQKLLARKVRKGKDFVTSQAAGLRDQAAEFVEQGKQFVEQGKEEVARHRQGVEQALDAGKRAYKESLG